MRTGRRPPIAGEVARAFCGGTQHSLGSRNPARTGGDNLTLALSFRGRRGNRPTRSFCEKEREQAHTILFSCPQEDSAHSYGTIPRATDRYPVPPLPLEQP